VLAASVIRAMTAIFLELASTPCSFNPAGVSKFKFQAADHRVVNTYPPSSLTNSHHFLLSQEFADKFSTVHHITAVTKREILPVKVLSETCNSDRPTQLAHLDKSIRTLMCFHLELWDVRGTAMVCDIDPTADKHTDTQGCVRTRTLHTQGACCGERVSTPTLLKTFKLNSALEVNTNRFITFLQTARHNNWYMTQKEGTHPDLQLLFETFVTVNI
jgi:hypothetical protein